MPIGLMPIRVSGHLLISYGLAIALGNGHTAHTLVSCPYIVAFLEYQECPHSTKGYNEVVKGNIVISEAWQCAVVRRHCDLLGSTNNDWTKAVLPSLSLSLSLSLSRQRGTYPMDIRHVSHAVTIPYEDVCRNMYEDCQSML